MKKLTKIALVCGIGFVLSACGGAPSCDDEDVKDLLTQTYHKNAPSTKRSSIRYEHFYTDFKDDSAKKVSCKARAVFSPAVSGVEFEDIEYVSYFTEDNYLYIELASDLINEKRWKDAVDQAIDEGFKEFEKELDKLF